MPQSEDPKIRRRRDQLTSTSKRLLEGLEAIPTPLQLVQLLKREARRRVDVNEARVIVERLRYAARQKAKVAEAAPAPKKGSRKKAKVAEAAPAPKKGSRKKAVKQAVVAEMAADPLSDTQPNRAQQVRVGGAARQHGHYGH